MGGRAAQEAAPEAEQALSALLSAKLPGIRALLRSSGSQTVVLNGHAYYINKGAGRTAVTIKTRVDATRMLKHLLCCNSNLAIQEAVLVKCIREIHGWMAARGPRGVGLTQAEGDEVYEICQRVKRLEGYDETGSEEEEEEEGDGAAGGGADDDDDDDDDEDDGDDDYRPSSPREPARDEPVALRPRHAGDASPDVNPAGRAAAAAGIAAAAAAGAAQVARTQAMPPGHEASERGTMASPPPPPAMTERERKRKARDERFAQLSREHDAALAAQEAADAAARAASARKRQADDQARRAAEQARRAAQEEHEAQAAAAAARQAVADLERAWELPGADA